MLARGIGALGSGSSGAAERELLPTVVASGDRTTDYAQGGRGLGAEARRRLPTVVATDFKGSAVLGQRRGTLAEEVAGQTLSAAFCEWHMGAPVGWGDLAPLPAGAVEAWVRAARDGSLWDAPPPMTCARGAEPRRAARIRQAGNGWVPLCAAVAFDLLSQDLGG